MNKCFRHIIRIFSLKFPHFQVSAVFSPQHTGGMRVSGRFYWADRWTGVKLYDLLRRMADDEIMLRTRPEQCARPKLGSGAVRSAFVVL